MMLRALKMPRLGETMEEGRIAGWLIEPGQEFKRGDPLLEIETDKTVAEFPALGEGRLHSVTAGAGELVAVGTPIAEVEVLGGVDWIAEEQAGESRAKPATEPKAEAPSELEPASSVVDLTMPRLGETMEEGRIARWLKAAGDAFARGEPLLEIETDKTVAEFPALQSGRLVEILEGEGATVAVDQPIGRIEVAGAPSAMGNGRVASLEEASTATDTVRDDARRLPAAEPSRGGRRRATPVARRLARQHGLDIDTLRGSGRRGRIESADVLGAVGGAALASRDEAASDAPEVRFADLSAGRMAYIDLGPRDGAPFLLLHGFAGDRTTWAAVASGLKRAGRRVLVPDLPGHGRTEIEAGDTDGLCAPLPAFLDDVASEARAIDLVAHSLGAVPAVALAKAAPDRVRRLTLLAPAGIGPEIDDTFIRGMAHAQSADGLAHWLRRLSVKAGELSAAARETLAADLARGRLRALAQAVAGPGGQQVDLLPDLAELARTLPVRVLVGLQDRIIPWRQVTALPSSIAVHFLAGAGHMPHWDEPREVLEILMASGRDGR